MSELSPQLSQAEHRLTGLEPVLGGDRQVELEFDTGLDMPLAAKMRQIVDCLFVGPDSVASRSHSRSPALDLTEFVARFREDLPKVTQEFLNFPQAEIPLFTFLHRRRLQAELSIRYLGSPADDLTIYPGYVWLRQGEANTQSGSFLIWMHQYMPRETHRTLEVIRGSVGGLTFTSTGADTVHIDIYNLSHFYLSHFWAIRGGEFELPHPDGSRHIRYVID